MKWHRGILSPKWWKAVKETISSSLGTSASSPTLGGCQPTTSSITLIFASMTLDGPYSAMWAKEQEGSAEQVRESRREEGCKKMEGHVKRRKVTPLARLFISSFMLQWGLSCPYDPCTIVRTWWWLLDLRCRQTTIPLLAWPRLSQATCTDHSAHACTWDLGDPPFPWPTYDHQWLRSKRSKHNGSSTIRSTPHGPNILSPRWCGTTWGCMP